MQFASLSGARSTLALGCKYSFVSALLSSGPTRAGGMGGAGGENCLIYLELGGDHLRLMSGFLFICMQLYYLYHPHYSNSLWGRIYSKYLCISSLCVCVYVCIHITDLQISENPPAPLIRLHEIHGCRYISE